MSANPYRKWLAFGTGAGIEAAGSDLLVTLARVRPKGAKVIETARIERYQERPAAEWGAEYAALLKRHGVPQLAATLVLARRDVVVRQLAMPGVKDEDLAQAIGFQLDGLHPFAEEQAVSAWARMDDGVNVLVGITRRDVIERWSGLLAEAGVKAASFTFSAAAIYGALRLFGAPPAPGFLMAVASGGEPEAYGESEAKPVFSAAFDVDDARARAMALSELRLPLDTPVTSAEPLSYYAALVSACPRVGLHVNLLPEELRAAGSKLIYVPSAVLAAMVIAGFAGLHFYQARLDQRYLETLQAAIARLEPQARKPMQMDKAIELARGRTALLEAFRRRTRDDLDALNDLTKSLEPPVFLNGLELTRNQVRLSGEAAQAAGLLQTIDKSPLFEGSEFTAPMSRTQTGEVFAIRARREGPAR